jgi:hypothetical protein
MALEARFQPVLDRLDVVVGGALDVLDGLGIGLAETQHQAAQVTAAGLGQGFELGEARVRQRDEPFHLDLHTAVHQAKLAHQRAQRGHARGVTPVQRRQGGEGGGRGVGHGGAAVR